MTCASAHGEFFPSSSGWERGFWADIYALGLESGPHGWVIGLKVEIWALRLDFVLGAGILNLRLGY